MTIPNRSPKIPGLKLIPIDPVSDVRGSFLKLYNASFWKKHGFVGVVSEVFVSTSKINVIRGLHFQTPPHEHDKIVICLSGKIRDVVFDLRSQSPTYGFAETFELSSDAPVAIFIPRGCAHGFAALKNDSTVAYLVSSEHDPIHDHGIHWDSIGINWGIKSPIISTRDSQHPRFEEFKTPFIESLALSSIDELPDK